MKKTRELIQENLKLVEAVIEVVDARIPLSSRNPVIDELIKGKKRILALNKNDIADSKETALWIAGYKEAGDLALPVNAMSGAGIPISSDCFRALKRKTMRTASEKDRCG